MSDDKYYISADGRVHSTPESAVAGSLTFEETSGTGAGCDQAAENVSSSDSSSSSSSSSSSK